MNNKEIRIFGAGGHAQVVIDTLETNSYNVVEIFDNSTKTIYTPNLVVKKILPDFSNFPTEGPPLIIAIGNNNIRKTIADKLSTSYISIIHKKAIVSSTVTIGIGTTIFAGAIIQANTRIGNHVIINSAASVDHDNKIDDFAHISPQVTLCGGVHISQGAFIGANSVIIPNIKVGKWATVGAGSVVIQDVPDYATVAGNPSKILKAKEYRLEVKKLRDKSEIQAYTDLITTYWENNIYYSYEYLKYYETPKIGLHYFLLTEAGTPKTIMPFYVRKIEGLSNYNDVITPYGYGGPIYSKNTKSNVLSEFWRLVDDWYLKNNIVTEFVRFNLNGNHLNYTGKLISTLLNVKGVIKTDDEKQWNQFSKKVRNNYRKAEKCNLEFSIYHGQTITEDVITQFHTVYTETMERNKAKDIFFFPKQYFENMIHANPDSFAIAITHKDNITYSTELIIINNNVLYAFLGGTRAKYFETRPNDHLRVEILRWAVRNNKEHYVLGGGLKDFDNLYKSKKAFFPKDNDAMYYTGRKIINQEIYDKLAKTTCIKKDEVSDCDYFPLYRDND